MSRHSGADKYVIEIDKRAFDFVEQHPEKLSKEAKATIEKYLDTML